MRRAIVLLLAAGWLACDGRPSPPAQRAREVASWLTASRGIVASWAAGSISSAGADTNLESTANMIDHVSHEGLSDSLVRQLREAVSTIEAVREAVRAGDKDGATAKAEKMLILARDLSR